MHPMHSPKLIFRRGVGLIFGGDRRRLLWCEWSQRHRFSDSSVGWAGRHRYPRPMDTDNLGRSVRGYTRKMVRSR